MSMFLALACSIVEGTGQRVKGKRRSGKN